MCQSATRVLVPTRCPVGFLTRRAAVRAVSTRLRLRRGGQSLRVCGPRAMLCARGGEGILTTPSTEVTLSPKP